MKTKPQKINPKQIADFQKSAAKKLSTARKTINIDEEAAYQIAYEAMVKASLAFILAHGQRVRAQLGHHIALIEFCERHLDVKHAPLLRSLDRMRRKRNQALYDVGMITRTETEAAIEVAEEYLTVIDEAVKLKLKSTPPVRP
jgi:uncharacterized protein (UPF0332 family)